MNISDYRSDIAEILNRITDKKTAPEEVIESSHKLLEYAKDRRDDALLGFAHYHRGCAYYKKNNIANFYLENLNSIKPLTDVRSWDILAKVYVGLSELFVARDNLPVAMEYLFKATDYINKMEESDFIYVIKAHIGRIYNCIGDVDEAEAYVGEAYTYIASHMGMEDYANYLAYILIEKGRNLLLSEKVEELIALKNELDTKALPFATPALQIRAHCLYSEMALVMGSEQGFRTTAENVVGLINQDVSLLDVFSDVIELLKKLAEKEEYDLLDNCQKALMPKAVSCGVKNVEKVLVMNAMQVARIKDPIEYTKLTERFVAISNEMDVEETAKRASMVELQKNNYTLKNEIIKKDEQLENLKQKSECDPLTGLGNRRALDDYLKASFDRACGNENSYAIELLDVDFFKEYGDNYGHHRADECLIFIAEQLKRLQMAHEGVRCHRYDGDMFAIVYEGYSEEEVFEIAKELKNCIVNEKRVNDFAEGANKFITLSQGVYWGKPKEGQNVYAYWNEADVLLYKVKQKSTNSIMLDKASTKEAKKVLKDDAPKLAITEPSQGIYEHYGQS